VIRIGNSAINLDSRFFISEYLCLLKGLFSPLLSILKQFYCINQVMGRFLGLNISFFSVVGAFYGISYDKIRVILRTLI